MKPFEPFSRPTQEADPSFSTETCISRSTFRSLSTDVQLDYARFYGLSDTGTLTADQICNSLFEEMQWTPALEIEGHVRHTTAAGVIVAKDVMDLVDWLVLHHTESTSTHTRLKSPEISDVQAQPEGMPTRFLEHRKEAVDCDSVDGNDTELSHNDLQSVAEDLRRSHTRLRKSVDASRKALREACADLFILRGQLEEENRYQTDVTSTITSVLGAEAMAGIQAQLDVEQKERRGTWSGVGRTKQKRRASKSDSARDPSLFPNAPYHVFTVPSTTSPASASASPKPHGEPADISSKRNRDDENEFDFEPHKRPRLAEYIPRTILNYTSDDKTDDTYSDSEGTERDFEDDAYSFLDFRGRPPRVELRSDSSSEEESQSDINNPPKSVPWSCIPDFEDDDTNDSDYQPPDWDMEDIWELNSTQKSRQHPLYRFAYDKELRQCEGVMSDASLSTDDPDAGYNEAGGLSFALRSRWLGLSPSLGPMLDRPRWDNMAHYRPVHRHGRTLIPPPREEAIARYKLHSRRIVKIKARDGFKSFPVDFEQRLDDLLTSDHRQFYYDDKEWTKFGPPPVSSRQPEPRSPKIILDCPENRWLPFLERDSE